MGTRGICLYLVLSLLILNSPALAQTGCNLDFLASQSFPTGGNPLVIISADWNEDGNLDLATSNILNPGVSILFSSTAGSFLRWQCCAIERERNGSRRFNSSGIQ